MHAHNLELDVVCRIKTTKLNMSLEIDVSERDRIQWKGDIILNISVRGKSGVYWISISFSLLGMSRPIS